MRMGTAGKIVMTVLLGIGVIGCGSGAPTNSRSSLSFAGESAFVSPVSSAVTSVDHMEVGDIFTERFDGSELLSIDLRNGAEDAEYILAVNNLTVGGVSSTVYLNNLATSVAAPAPTPSKSAAPVDIAGQFHDQLRQYEREYARPLSLNLSKAAAVGRSEPSVGQVSNFSVISSVTSLNQTTSVEAELFCVGDHILYYLDTEVVRRNPEDYTRAEVERVCEDFDAQAGDMKRVLGDVSDIDGNGRVVVLSTPQVNRLGSLGGGVITGFFFSNDLHGGNFGEVLYTVVPDSRGIYGLAVPKQMALQNLIPAVLPHELQHAINYTQHVLHGDGVPEESWLNEAISHVAEDHWGIGLENPSRYALYLDRPEAHSLVTFGSPGLLSRGGMYLLARYLYEQSGDGEAFMSRLVKGGETGVANLEAALASSDSQFDEFAEFMMRWSAALVLSDSGLTNDARYTYAERSWGDLPGVYTGVCTRCSADDNRGTILNGVQATDYSTVRNVTTNPTTVSFYRVAASQVPEIELWGVGQGQFGAVLVRVK